MIDESKKTPGGLSDEEKAKAEPAKDTGGTARATEARAEAEEKAKGQPASPPPAPQPATLVVVKPFGWDGDQKNPKRPGKTRYGHACTLPADTLTLDLADPAQKSEYERLILTEFCIDQAALAASSGKSQEK